MSDLLVEFKQDKLIVSEFGCPTMVFQLVDKFPLGYMVWNIGKHHMPEGYLPLCRLSPRQPFPGGKNIEVETLRAMKVDGADVILDAMGYGPNTLKEMEAFIEKYNDAKPGSYLYRRVKRIKKALPYMRQIQPT